MSEAKIVAEMRSERGKGAARRARRAGYVPAIVYVSDIEPLPLQLNKLALERFVSSFGTGRLVDLQIGDKTDLVLLKEVQRDPVRGDIIHVDFHKVRLDQEVTVTVPIVLVGEQTERTPDGGLITQLMHEATVSCLPTRIPENIEVSVEGLPVGRTITDAALQVPAGVTLTDDPEQVVVSVVVPRAEAEPEADEGDADVEADAEAAAEGDAETTEDSEDE